MIPSCLSTESRRASADRFSPRTAEYFTESWKACCSASSGPSATCVVRRWRTATRARARPTETTPKMRCGSLTLAAMPESVAPIPALVPRPRALRPAPGSRLISIMSFGRFSSGGGAEGEADRQHQQRRDLVRDERFEGAVTHLDVGERIGLLDLQAEAIGERCGDARDAGAAAARVDGAHLRTRA